MSRFWFLRRPLMLFGVLALIVGAYVAIAVAVNAHQQHEQDVAFRTWMVRSEAATEAKLPVLMRQLAEVPFPADIKRATGSPARLGDKFVAFFGPERIQRSPAKATAVVVDALRRARFTNVAVLDREDGSKVVGTTSAGQVWIYIHPSGTGAKIVGSLNPAIPHCC